MYKIHISIPWHEYSTKMLNRIINNEKLTKLFVISELSDDCEIFVDPETGKLFMRTKSGNILGELKNYTTFNIP